MPTQHDMWKDQFGEVYVEVYEHLQTHGRSRDQAHDVARVLGARKGDRVLDACCGQGRHLREFLVLGLDASGVEQSGFLVRKARTEYGIPTDRIIQSDILDYAAPGRFDFVVNLYTAFGFFADPAQDLAAIRKMHECLKPGGTLLLETIYARRDWPDERRFLARSGANVVESNRFDTLTGTLAQKVKVTSKDKPARHFNTTVRTFDEDTLASLFSDAGFSEIRIANGLATEQPRLNSFEALAPQSVRIACFGQKPLV